MTDVGALLTWLMRRLEQFVPLLGISFGPCWCKNRVARLFPAQTLFGTTVFSRCSKRYSQKWNEHSKKLSVRGLGGVSLPWHGFIYLQIAPLRHGAVLVRCTIAPLRPGAVGAPCTIASEPF